SLTGAREAVAPGSLQPEMRIYTLARCRANARREMRLKYPFLCSLVGRLARNYTDRRASRQTILRIVSLAQWSVSHRRLLLGDAVDIATTEQYFPPRHHHYAPVGEQLLEYLAGTGILRITERRCDDAAIDDQEVHIGASQTNLR